VQAIHATGVPTVVILINGRPLAEPWVVDNVAALIEAWEPGALGGRALAEIIVGQVNPSGKMPITVPYSAGHLKAIYNHKPTATVRKYIDAPTHNLYEFGDGLSYTDFAYSDVKLSRLTMSMGESTQLSVVVRNVGERSGDEVVQLYVRDDFSAVTRPVKELKGFKRVSLAPGAAQEVYFDITPEALGYFGIDMSWQVEPGDFSIMVGGSSRSRDLETVTLRVRPE
jgi:beta-glucosidase